MNGTIGALLALTVVAASLAAGLIQDVRRNRSAVPWQPIREPQEPPHVAGDDVTAWRTGGAHRAVAPLRTAPAVPLHPLLHQLGQWWRQRTQPDVHVGATEQWSPAAEYGGAGQSDDAAALAAPAVPPREPIRPVYVSDRRARLGAALERFLARHPDVAETLARTQQDTIGWDAGPLREQLDREEAGTRG